MACDDDDGSCMPVERGCTVNPNYPNRSDMPVCPCTVHSRVHVVVQHESGAVTVDALSNTSEKHPQNTRQTIQTKIFETPEPNTYDNPLGLQDLPRSESDAHVDPTKESVQTTKET